MKKPLLAVAMGILTLALTACSGGSSSTPSPTRWDGQKLTVWIMEGTNPDASGFFNEVKTGFKAKTGADLDIQMVPWSGAEDKFTTAIAGKTTPDVAEVGTTWTTEFADSGALVDLTQKVKDAGLQNDLVQSLVDAGTLDGKLYGMPWYAGVRSIIYNKDIFAKAGINTPPSTWDELTADVTKIKTAEPNVIPLPVPGNSEYSTLPWIWGAGGEVATENNGKWTSGLNSSASVKGLSYWTDLASKYNSSTPAAATWTEKDVLKAYEQGNVAMAIQGSWTPATLKTDAPSVYASSAAFPIPGQTADKPSSSFVGGSHLDIFNNSKNKDLSWEFVKYMTTGDMATKWAAESHYFPGLKSLMDAQTKSTDPLVAPFATQMLNAGRSVPVTPLYGQTQGAKIIPTMTQSILSGNATVQQAADKAAAASNKIYAG